MSKHKDKSHAHDEGRSGHTDKHPTSKPVDPTTISGEAVYLVPSSLNGTDWRADSPNKDNCVFFDTDDITWIEEPNWEERQIPGRDVVGQTFLGGGGEQLSFTAAINDEHAASQPLGTVEAQIALLKEWNRAGQILQFVSTYHNVQMMCVLRSFQRVSPIAFSTDNYYEYTLKLREFKPILIEYGGLSGYSSDDSGSGRGGSGGSGRGRSSGSSSGGSGGRGGRGRSSSNSQSGGTGSSDNIGNARRARPVSIRSNECTLVRLLDDKSLSRIAHRIPRYIAQGEDCTIIDDDHIACTWGRPPPVYGKGGMF